MNRKSELENGDDPKDQWNEQEEITINEAQFYCKKCHSLVWISNESNEVIRNRFLFINFNKKYGLCRYCFVSVKDLNVLFEGVVDDGK
jgi:hypothetical protein